MGNKYTVIGIQIYSNGIQIDVMGIPIVLFNYPDIKYNIHTCIHTFFILG